MAGAETLYILRLPPKPSEVRPSTPQPDLSADSWKPEDVFAARWGWLVLLALTMVALLPGLATIPLLDRDEPRFVQATVEMAQRGDWIVPTFNGDFRFDKPPLTYWWMGLHFWLLGQSDFSARLASVVAAWLAALGILGFGGRLFRPAAGLLAAGGWLLTFQLLVHGRLAVADLPMVASVVYIFWLSWELLFWPPWRPFRWRFWALWLAVAIGFLAKGPIVLLVPGLAWGIFAVLGRLSRRDGPKVTEKPGTGSSDRQECNSPASSALPRLSAESPATWRQLQPMVGLLLAFLVVALWGIPALVLTAGEFWEVGMGEHVVKRGTETFNGRWANPAYYLITPLVSLLPWVAFYPAALAKLIAGWDRRMAYLLAWGVAPVLIFSFYATQLLHYILPGFAAFFLVLFAPAGERGSLHPLAALPQATSRLRWLVKIERWWFFGCVGLWSLMVLATVALVTLGDFPGEAAGLQGVIGGLGMVVAALVTLVLTVRWVPAARRGWPGYLGSMVLLAVGFSSFGQNLRPLLPAIQLQPLFFRDLSVTSTGSEADRHFSTATEAVTTLFSEVLEPRDCRPLGIGYAEPSLVYYTAQRWAFREPLAPNEALDLAHHDVFLVLVREYRIDDWLSAFWDRSGPPEPSTDHSGNLPEPPPGYDTRDLHGVNPLGRTSWVHLRLYAPKNWLDEADSQNAGTDSRGAGADSGDL